jgi:hypothetical protein
MAEADMKSLIVAATAISGTLGRLRDYACDREARHRGQCWIPPKINPPDNPASSLQVQPTKEMHYEK